MAVIHPPAPPRRTISECIVLLPEDSTAVMDADFSPRMSRQPSRAIANCSNRPHGTDPRFQCADHCRATGQNARQMLAAIGRTAGNTDIAISVVTLIELAHGAARADTAQRKEKRHQFIHELLTAMPIHPVTVMVALRVGQIDGENQAKGVRPSTRRSFDRRHGLGTRL